MTHCPRCGYRLDSGRCIPCDQKDTMASCPAVLIDSTSFKVDEVRLTQTPGRVFHQPISLERAIELDLILAVQEGYDTALYLRSSRVRVVVKRKEP
jgi:hypothetical protein